MDFVYSQSFVTEREVSGSRAPARVAAAGRSRRRADRTGRVEQRATL